MALACELQDRTHALKLSEMFMAVLSHDLRGPLSAILASAAVLRKTQEPDKVLAMADKVQTSAQRMGRMIEDLLDVTRARQFGGLPVRAAPADLGELVQRTAAEWRTSHPERVIEVLQEGDLGGQWDAERLCQVVSNLLGNAIHHGDPQQPVQASLDGSAPHSVVMTVRNGGEIPQALIPQLFDPFRGREREPGRHQGLGLGLYIVHQIVQGHGGTISVCSRDGRTIFRVEPAARGAALRAVRDGLTDRTVEAGERRGPAAAARRAPAGGPGLRPCRASARCGSIPSALPGLPVRRA